MDEMKGINMKSTNRLLVALLMCFPIGLFAGDADQPAGQPTNTIAVMSEEIIQARLSALGFQPIRIVKTNALRYQVTAIKAGKVIVVDFHPQLGTVESTHQSVSGAMDLMPREITPASAK
jgi:hypothetical protein